MKRWIFWILIVAVLSALYQRYYQPEEIARQFTGLSSSLSGKYLAARFAERHGKHDEAADNLAAALKKDPTNLRILERSFALHVMTGKMDDAIADATLYRGFAPRAFAANNMLAIAEMKKGNFVAADQYLQSITAGASEEDLKMHALLLPIIRGWVLVGQGRYPDARQLLDTIDPSSELLPFILYQRALMADVGNNQKDAARIYDTLLESISKPSYRLSQAAASFFSRIGRKERAQEIVEAFNEAHPSFMITGIPKSPPIASAPEGLAEFFMETSSLLYGRQMTETSLVYLNLALYLRPDLSYAQFLLASVQENRKMYEEAIRYFEMLRPEDPFYGEAQIAIARDYYKLGNTNKAKQFLEARLRIKENDKDALGMLADFALQEKDFDKAAEYYTRLLDLPDGKDSERWAWYFSRGISLERLNKWQKAEPDFMKALELKPNHPEVMNYLAYTWVTQGVNLEKARDMLNLAVEARPNDAHIIDSYGWVLYTLGEYEEALLYMERANELMPADPTVNDHMGDVYWQLGRKREAKFQWERALSFDPEPEDAAKIRQKLEHGLKPSKN
jgi:tetratricopeptide (TPR) repeat protein